MYEEYSVVRDVVALPKGQLREIAVPANTQPCNTFGIHPDLSYIEELYEDNDASFFANIGNLIEPITVAEYNSKTKQIPMGLFAHNTQVEHSQAVHPQRGDAKGILGRIVGALSSQNQPYKTMSYSISGSQKIMEGPITPHIISPKGGAVRLLAFDSNSNGKLGAPLLNMSRATSSSIFAETWSALLEASIENTESLGAHLEAATVEETFDEDRDLCLMLQQVAKLISLSQGSDRAMDTERDAFVVNLGGFDTHSNLLEDFSANMQELNSCVATFVRELKHTPGLWDNVAVTTLSDFGRTITSNGIGTDHGWGGNHMLLGGSVNGGRIHGRYPAGLTEDSAQMLSRGRLIPTTPWEGLWHGVAEWMDVDPEKMAEVLPNMGNFASGQTLFTKEQLFAA
jgi:cullin-associated NEDD8-dissociated protein 1